MVLMFIEDEYTVCYDDGANMMMVLMVIGIDEYTVWYDDGANMMKVLMVIEDEYTV